MTRRLTIQDLIDARYYDAIPAIASCPVSLVFRLRGIRLLAEAGLPEGKVSAGNILTHIDRCLRDRPETLELIHAYEQPPELSQLIDELYHTDFGRCYLAVKTILADYADEAPAALSATYEAQAKADYGGHFHVIKLMGWLKHRPAYDTIVTALNNPQPQFQKSRAAAAIALGELGETKAIPLLEDCLDSNIWDLKYAALMALEQLGYSGDRSSAVAEDEDWLVRMKAASLLATAS